MNDSKGPAGRYYMPRSNVIASVSLCSARDPSLYSSRHTESTLMLMSMTCRIPAARPKAVTGSIVRQYAHTQSLPNTLEQAE